MSFESVKLVVEPATVENVGINAYPIREFVSVKVTPAAVGYSGITSTSNITIGTGVKTFTLTGGNAGAFITGQRIRAIHSTTPTYWMEGYANYIGGGTLILTVDLVAGSGTHNAWNFAIAGQVGATGPQGPTGPVGPTGGVSSVAGRTGAVTLASADITDATNAATANTLVKRSSDGSANFHSVSVEAEVFCNSLTVYDQADQPVTVTGYSGAITASSNAGSFTIGLDRSFTFFDGNYFYGYSFPSFATGTIALSNQSQTFTADQTFNGIVSLANPEQSTSFSTGALRMSGGACIGKNLNVGGATGTAASTTTTAGLKVPHGAAPTSPVNGDVWTTTAGSFIRINGTTRQTATLSDTQSFSGNQTFSGTAAFTNTARPTAANVTGTPASTDLITLGDADTRYGTPYNLRVLTDVSSASLSYVNSTDTVTLPAGTYFFQGNIVGLTASTTGGINVNFYTNSDTNTTGSVVFQSSSANGTGSTATMTPRNGAALFQYLANAFADAPLKACSSIFSGTVTFSTSQTITPRVSQRSVADTTFAAILKAGSMVRFIKIA